MTTSNWTTARRALMCGVLLTLASTPALAATPATASVEGFLTSSGGGAAADGTYGLTFKIYANSSTLTPLWSEGPVQVKVTKGQFSWTLGSKTGLSATTSRSKL